MNMMNNNANMNNMNSNMNNVMNNNNNDPFGMGYGGFGPSNNMNNINNGMNGINRNMSMGGPMGNMNMMNMMNMMNNNANMNIKNANVNNAKNDNNCKLNNYAIEIDDLPLKFEDALNSVLLTKYYKNHYDFRKLFSSPSINIRDSLGFAKSLYAISLKSKLELESEDVNTVHYYFNFVSKNDVNSAKINAYFDRSTKKWTFDVSAADLFQRLNENINNILGKKNLNNKDKNTLYREAQCLMSFLIFRFLFPMDKWFDNNGVHNDVEMKMGSWDMNFQKIKVKTISRNSCELEFYNGTGTSNNSIKYAKVRAILNDGRWNLEDIR